MRSRPAHSSPAPRSWCPSTPEWKPTATATAPLLSVRTLRPQGHPLTPSPRSWRSGTASRMATGETGTEVVCRQGYEVWLPGLLDATLSVFPQPLGGSCGASGPGETDSLVPRRRAKAGQHRSRLPVSPCAPAPLPARPHGPPTLRLGCSSAHPPLLQRPSTKWPRSPGPLCVAAAAARQEPRHQEEDLSEEEDPQPRLQ